MIFPFLQGFPSLDKAPLTWIILALNFLIFSMTFSGQLRQETKMEEVFSKDSFLTVQGKVYSQFKDSSRMPASAESEPFAKNEVFVAVQSVRDTEFLTTANDMKFAGDQVAIGEWQVGLTNFLKEEKLRPARIFGLSEGKMNWRNWITYQFMHGGIIHLISNMLILLIFGGVLESRMGSLGFLSVYLLSGFFGALFFLKVSGVYGSPLIGASGAIFGLIGCYTALEPKKRVRFFYFASPMNGYWGFVYLPTLFVISVCILPEVASFLSTPDGLGGVAYGAHNGGALFGILIGLILRKPLAHTPS
ncbi:MAG: rhomboid family intramembrane serine protease [Pseudobdellovibrionaceae bacterium]